MTTARAADEPIASEAGTIHLRVAGLRQLFNSMDPSPFRNRDLDPGVSAFSSGSPS